MIVLNLGKLAGKLKRVACYFNIKIVFRFKKRKVNLILRTQLSVTIMICIKICFHQNGHQDVTSN